MRLLVYSARFTVQVHERILICDRRMSLHFLIVQPRGWHPIGYRVGQVRCVFSIPEKRVRQIFAAGVIVPKYLVYIECFTAFKSQPEPNHLVYKISRAENRDGERLSSIIPIGKIRRSVHLFPKFGRVAPRHWTSSSVLEKCSTFFVSGFTYTHSYVTIY
jgi:hypothetical protein